MYDREFNERHAKYNLLYSKPIGDLLEEDKTFLIAFEKEVIENLQKSFGATLEEAQQRLKEVQETILEIYK